MAKIYFCISEKIQELGEGKLLTGVIIESDCALEPGEDPNNSVILKAREAIIIAINIAVQHLLGMPIHIPREGEPFDHAMAVARDKTENPFSSIEELPETKD